MIHITHDMYVLSNEQVYRLCTFNLYISYILQITSCGQKDTDSTCGTRIAVSQGAKRKKDNPCYDNILSLVTFCLNGWTTNLLFLLKRCNSD